MSTIIIDEKLLHKQRRSQVRRMLSSLTSPSDRFSVQPIGTKKDAYVLAAVQNNESGLASLSPEEPLINTRIRRVMLNYHEIWKQQREAGYYLERAYMHFHVSSQSGRKQILSLHCDPSLKDGSVHFGYGRGPHLHLEGANPDIARAHVSVCVADPRKGGSTLNDLMACFQASVRMIADEILPCWERGGTT